MSADRVSTLHPAEFEETLATFFKTVFENLVRDALFLDASDGGREGARVEEV